MLAWAIGTVLDVFVAHQWSVFASARSWASVTHIVANAIVSASICALFVIDIDHSVAIHVEGSGAVLLGAPLRGGGVSAAACGPAASLFSCCCLPAAWLLLRFGAPQLE